MPYKKINSVWAFLKETVRLRDGLVEYGTLTTKHFISNVRARSLNSSRLTLVPGVPDHIIDVLKVYIFSTRVTTSRGGNRTGYVRIWDGSDSIDMTTDASSTAMVGSSSTQVSILAPGGERDAGMSRDKMIGKPVEFSASGAMTGGSSDNTLTVVTFYTLIHKDLL